jgi:hypothetical protein
MEIFMKIWSLIIFKSPSAEGKYFHCGKMKDVVPTLSVVGDIGSRLWRDQSLNPPETKRRSRPAR